jgi:hypothetical protein
MTAVEFLHSEYKKIIGDTQVTFAQMLEITDALEKAKKMESMQSFPNVNRVEVIQHSEPYNGRVYANHNAKDIEVQLQDNGKTLKIFLR